MNKNQHILHRYQYLADKIDLRIGSCFNEVFKKKLNTLIVWILWALISVKLLHFTTLATHWFDVD